MRRYTKATAVTAAAAAAATATAAKDAAADAAHLAAAADAAEVAAHDPAEPCHPPNWDCDRALEQFKMKVSKKLQGHELEDGWRVEWEEAGRRGEKVFYDPMAPGTKLRGEAAALTHVKNRLKKRPAAPVGPGPLCLGFRPKP